VVSDYPTIHHAYVDTLPWDDMSDHPLFPNGVSSSASGVVSDVVREEQEQLVSADVREVQRLIAAVSPSSSYHDDDDDDDEDDDDCRRGVLLVRSRAFHLSPSSCCCAMVPVLDVFNHPSVSALTQYGPDVFHHFSTTPISHSTVRWTVSHHDNDGGGDSDGGDSTIRVYGPRDVNVIRDGTVELWNWYGNGGYVDDAVRREQELGGVGWDQPAHDRFVARYGFDPWK
jgi:hypothetical protein